MKDINYIFIVLIVIGGLISTFTKNRQIGLNTMKISVIVFILFNLAPVIYSYIDKLIK